MCSSDDRDLQADYLATKDVARRGVQGALDALATLVATRPRAPVLVEDVLTLVAESLDVGLVFVSRIDAATSSWCFCRTQTAWERSK
jgi:hypothetical protein